MPDVPIYQIKITLVGSTPSIWRRIAVAGDTPLDELHPILQIAMGWTDSHLHAFRAGGVVYGELDPDYSDGLQDEAGVRLDRIAAEGDTLYYEYDFGDSWDHELKIETVRAPEPDVRYPRCLAGERECPPEDCGGVPGYEELLRVLSDPDDEEYEETRDWLGGDFDPAAFDVQEVNGILEEFEADDIIEAPPGEPPSNAELATLDEQTLIETLRRWGDRAPRNLIDACAARGDAMVQALENLLAAPRFWDDDVEAGSWWLRLHTARILGLIATESAGLQLVELMRRLDAEEDEDTQEWLAGEWPALFANKPDSLAHELRCLAEDRTHDWYIRSFAAESYLALAHRDGESAFEAALDWVAALAADEEEDWTLRLSLGGELLHSPRPRHRPLLDMLASQQTGLDAHFHASDVEYAYARGGDAPQWERFADPWIFYDPEVIAARQERWAKEDRRRAERIFADDDWEESPTWQEPYVRQEPKIGRNDPCPCGSGKKYKKCCLNKLH